MIDSAATLRVAQDADLDTVLQLNQGEAHWTSNLAIESLKRLSGYACAFDVAVVNNQVMGFMLAMSSQSAYPNANLAWFQSRMKRFWYVDRIVVSSGCAGQGVGRKLYERLFETALDNGVEHITCEYSAEPLNEGSAAFHQRLGFREIGVRRDDDNGKTLSMQVCDLNTESSAN